ncbi:hypothetical protein [Citrobacter werkmanii]|uniref:hypothetical protein n=1 Tax=Citrobacter werkmanii TaxID=67827 RepID=UPI001D0A3DE1|nr:hypothetical protein [Citrobacter werkmanii]MBS6074291.1 hypothetical protein [Citrobacter freundii]MBY6245148.1 hypothetical protein [Citrobacter werkmanii]MBY6251961.1 hypothetical protein [Citrobacter werkmanii]
MERNKLVSTLRFVSTKTGNSFKYEIYIDLDGNPPFAVLYTEVKMSTDLDPRNFGDRDGWVKIDGYIRLNGPQVSDLESECESHFKGMLV